ncbi:HD-GYP domain-containing protein [Sporosarcina aquimarina]|uniref:HD-GYP domain-containing protein n=1 Tax=Sporosarcina aquimarina TaxID=114975 RepID=A0ABU4G2Q5_9BACL|nr:HD-GYP domain-containing protein [Sporosarcina aquimarina]MDW0111260.1 HD-GYP domain-containing protein [Sporosarcina aquimarina]
MENFRSLNDLRPGTTVAEDIYANTVFPILRKGTILEMEHIETLYLFNIKQVKVEDRIVSRVQTDQQSAIDSDTIKSDVDQILNENVSRTVDIQTMYIKAVNQYKKEFSSWRSGMKLDIAKVRLIIMPLLETFMTHKNSLVILNEYSNRKDYLYHHAVSVGIVTAVLANELGYPKGTTLQLGLAGTLADCGMAKVNPVLLEKAAFLTNNEFIEVKKHPIYSFQMIQDSSLLRQEMKLAVLQHHERLDGSGYPRGDKSEKISPLSQILAVADVFHAMTCERVYRAKESLYRVVEMLKEEDFGKFDIDVLNILSELIGTPAAGDKVLLTNGESGEVTTINHKTPLRPSIKLKSNGEVVDLTTDYSIAIEKLVVK